MARSRINLNQEQGAGKVKGVDETIVINDSESDSDDDDDNDSVSSYLYPMEIGRASCRKMRSSTMTKLLKKGTKISPYRHYRGNSGH